MQPDCLDPYTYFVAGTPNLFCVGLILCAFIAGWFSLVPHRTVPCSCLYMLLLWNASMRPPAGGAACPRWCGWCLYDSAAQPTCASHWAAFAEKIRQWPCWVCVMMEGGWCAGCVHSCCAGWWYADARSMVSGAWSVSCADWRSFVLTVGVPCLFWSLAVPGVWSFLHVTAPCTASYRHCSWDWSNAVTQLRVYSAAYPAAL